MSEQEKPKRGRPSSYTPELAAEICARLRDGQSLREICRSEHMPDEAAVRSWAVANVDGFSPHYTEARQVGYAKLADELLDISDDGKNDWMERQDPENPGYNFNGEHYQRSRLRVDTRKWILAKMLPKVYGDKITQEVSGPDGGPIPVSLVELVPVAPASAQSDTTPPQIESSPK